MIRGEFSVIVVSFFALILTAGCSGSNTFSTGSRNKNPAPPSNPLSPEAAIDSSQTRSTAEANSEGKETGKEELPQDNINTNLTADFTYGPLTAQSDFLILFDNSSSMQGPAESVARGFESLAASKWPAGSRIGVMTTLPGNPADLNEVHPETTLKNRYQGMEKEPGFLRLVSAAALRSFAAATESSLVESNYPLAICEKEWFLPEDKNSSGVSCLRASFQSVFAGVGVEAGLTAALQMATKNPSLFRPNAQVHVIFVSDTQDPGDANASELISSRPDYQKIEAAFRKNSPIASLKIHGIVPDEKCITSGESFQLDIAPDKLPYQQAIKASGGTWLNFCGENGTVRSDYTPVAAQIIEGSFPEAIFQLQRPARTLVSVAADGKILTSDQARLDADGTRVRLSSFRPSADVKITIVYEPLQSR
jgi:hypothetical protein